MARNEKGKQDNNGTPMMGGGHMGAGRALMTGKQERAKDAKGTLKRIGSYLERQKGKLIFAFTLVVLSTGLGLLGPYFISVAIDEFIKTGITNGFARLLLLMGAVYIGSATIAYIQQYVLLGISQGAVRDMRNDLFSNLMTYSLKFFDKTPNGELMSRLTNDIESVNTTLSQNMSQFISSVLSIVGVVVIMFALNWQLAIISILTIPMIIGVIKFIGQRSRLGFRDQQKSLGKLNGIIEETLSGQKVVKVYGKEKKVIEEFSQTNQQLKEASIRAELFGGFMGPSMNLTNNLRFAIIAAAGGYLAVNGLVSIGVIAAFINYSRQFGRPLTQLANVYNTIQAAISGAERVFEVMDRKPELEDAKDAIALDEVEGHVKFKAVDFSYVKGTKVLKQANFEAKSGDIIAIVGPTGAGKTTIINLLTRFYDIDSGEIHIDGIDIKGVQKNSLRSKLGIVLQDTYLFTGTVRDNIRYGRLDATDKEVEEAAKMAHAHQFIKHLPEGYDTHLSQEGSQLSQGQRQLIAIARTILSDPSILILDEATSSVDTRTEVYIQKAMLNLMEGRTSFVIAHRLSTIKDATKIMVMDQGEIIEMGSHDELLEEGGFYSNLYQSQFKKVA